MTAVATVVNHAPLGKIRAHLQELERRGVFIGISEKDGALVLIKAPANVEMKRKLEAIRWRADRKLLSEWPI